MLNTENPTCDFCQCQLPSPAYFPKGTRRGVAVHVCPNCGLCQSSKSFSESDRIRTLSTDADWGNVRHGKSVRFGALRTILERELDWSEVHRAADIGANRGDFIVWLKTTRPLTEIWAIEPDASVISAYAELPEVILHVNRLEHVSLPAAYFDLIFCSHTLEHADSATTMLDTIRQALRPGGMLLLEIPNLAGITGEDVVEEFFIDKHTFHFDRETLLDYLKTAGFSVLCGADDTDDLNITLLLRREDDKVKYLPCDGQTRSSRNRQWLADFANRLPKNRELLKRMVDEKLRPLGTRQKVGYWGAGRIFDALVKYGGLESKDVYCLVDRHLYGIVAKAHGIAIERPEALRLQEPQVLVTLGRSAEDLMARTAYAFGIRHVLKFSELIEQVRETPITNEL